MTAKELIVGAALLLGALTAAIGTSSAAQARWYHHWYGHRYHGLYNNYGRGRFSPPDYQRGGPGPRVLDGSGMGIGAVR